MPDREKVIAELQEYHDREWTDERMDGLRERNIRKQVTGNALALLKEQEDEIAKFCGEVARLTAMLKEQEAKEGHWIVLEFCANEGIYCSECHMKIFDRITKPKKQLSQYCPHCGSRNEQFFRDDKVVFR